LPVLRTLARPIVTHRVGGVCLWAGRSVTLVSPAKTAEPIEMPLGLRTHVDPKNHVLDGDPCTYPMGRGNLEGEEASHYKLWGHSAVICAKTTESTEMLFGLWARMGTRKHVLDTAQILNVKGQLLQRGHARACSTTLSRELYKMAEPIDLKFGMRTRVGRSKHKFNRIRQLVPTCPHGREFWHHLSKTIGPSV